MAEPRSLSEERVGQGGLAANNSSQEESSKYAMRQIKRCISHSLTVLFVPWKTNISHTQWGGQTFFYMKGGPTMFHRKRTNILYKGGGRQIFCVGDGDDDVDGEDEEEGDANTLCKRSEQTLRRSKNF